MWKGREKETAFYGGICFFKVYWYAILQYFDQDSLGLSIFYVLIVTFFLSSFRHENVISKVLTGKTRNIARKELEMKFLEMCFLFLNADK